MHENPELIGLIDRQIGMAERVFSALPEAETHDIPLLGRTSNAAALIAGLHPVSLNPLYQEHP